MSGVDLLLADRQRPVAAGVGIETPPTLRNPDRRATALTCGIGDGLNPGTLSASMIPCS
jgi:hypothetical protein